MELTTGKKAPNFTLQDTEGKKINLYDYLKNDQGLLLFFPLAFSSTCTEEVCTIRDNMKLYESLNARVIGISIDSFFTLKAFKKSQNLNFKLLSDFNREVAELYGVLYNDYFGMKGVSKRASFAIGENKDIVHVEVLEDSGELPDFNALQHALNQS